MWKKKTSGSGFKFNCAARVGSGRVGSDDLGYGPGSGFILKPVQTSSPESVSKFNVEPSVYPASNTERSANPVSINVSNCELSVGLNFAVKSEYELSVCPDLVTEMSTSPASVKTTNNELFTTASVNALNCELSANPIPINAFNYELSVCPTPVTDLSARSVATSETTDECLVFPASVLETVNSMPVSRVSVFPRLQSLLWVPDLLWCSPIWPWCSSDPSWCSPALSALHWWAPALSAPPWRSPTLSAPHWWAPALSAPPWRSAVSLWWSSVPLWRSSAPSWWSSASSAQVWWSSAPLW